MDESRPRGGVILPVTLVQNGTAGGNNTAGGTLHQPVLGFLVINPLLGGSVCVGMAYVCSHLEKFGKWLIGKVPWCTKGRLVL